MANDIIGIVVTDNSDNVQLNVTPNLVSINVSQTSGNIIGSNYFLASTFGALPITGDTTTLYVINDTSLMYRWSGSAYTQINSSAVVAWGQITGALSGQTDLQNALNAKAPLASPTFTGTVSGITKAMVGLSNVDNTSDVNKPVSSATQTALDFKANIASPTFTGTVGGITKAMVGLGNVDNTTDANKPISTATQTALDTKAPLASPTFTGTVSGITKSMVGLGNVDNTTDLLKPISTATQSALNLKYDASNPSGYTTNVGTVTSVGGTGTVSGLSLSGSVTTSGNLTLGGTLSLTSGNVTTALGYTPYNATNPSGYISGITNGQVTTALGYTPENSANKGIANGYASLDGGGLVPSTQLPSYVDDVLEFADLAAFPASGTTGKIYVALDTNKIYRWSGATYIEVSPTVGTIWGGITGTLSNQTDLQNALNTKQNNLSGTGFVKSTAGTISYDTATYYPYPTGDTTQYVGGDGSLIAFPVAGQSGTIVRLVRNNTGATLTKGTVIYISGATGNNPVVSKAIATGDARSAQTFGLCQANIANNATGYVVVMGDLIGLDTSAFTEGQQVYLSGTVAGTFTATKQYAPIHLVYIGVITRAHPTLGQIEVKIQNGYELDEIHNVSAQSPANNDIIAFNTSNSLWEKKSIATALGFTPYNATNPNNYIALTALSSTATGLTYTNTTGVFSLTAGYAIPTTASATNWDTAYTNRITSLTVTGSSGSATLVSNVLNIPTYTLSGLGGITATFLSGTSGISYNSTTGVISTSLTQYTDALARASVSLTTTGTSGASTYNSTTGVLNIPQYQSVLTNPVTGTGTTNYIAKFTSSTGIGNSIIYDNGTSVGIGTTTINGTGTILSIYNATDSQIRLQSGVSGQLSTDGGLISLASDSSMYFYNYENAPIYFGTNNSIRVTIASTGAATFSSSVTSGIAKFSNWATVGTFARFGHSSYDTGTNYGYLQDSSGNIYMEGTTTNISTTAGGITNVGGSLYGTRALFNSDFLQNETSKVGIGFAGGYAQFNSWGANTSTYGGFKFQISVSNGGTYDALKIAPSGVATFAGSVTIGSALNNSLSVGLTQPTTDTLNQIFAGQAAFGGQNSAGGETDIGHNWYYYSGWKYRFTSPSSNIKLNGDVISFERAASGTANAAISFLESMRITSGGYTKISNNGGYVDVNQPCHELNNSGTDWNTIVRSTSTSSPNGINIRYTGTSVNGVNNQFIYCLEQSSLRFEVRSNGGIANYAANNSVLSDERMKKEILPLESYWNKFKNIEIVKYKYKDQTHDDFNIGLIAQQVELIAPEFVDTDGFGTTPEDGIPLKTIYSTDLYHATIKVLQEAMIKIEELSAEITILKNK